MEDPKRSRRDSPLKSFLSENFSVKRLAFNAFTGPCALSRTLERGLRFDREIICKRRTSLRSEQFEAAL